MNKRLLLIIVGGIVALSAVGLTIFLTQTSKDPRSRAQTPAGTATTPSPTPPLNTLTSAAPATPQNVLVEYPSCTDLDCSFLAASCAWDAVSDAANYQLKVTEVDTGTVVYDQSQAASVNKIVFPVAQNKVYQCDVTALNADGQASGTGSHSLLCQTDGIVEPTTPPVVPTEPPPPTKEPTAVPTVVSSPSATLAPTIPMKTTSSPTPTIESPGAPAQSIAIVGAAVMTMIIGVLLLAM